MINKMIAHFKKYSYLIWPLLAIVFFLYIRFTGDARYNKDKKAEDKERAAENAQFKAQIKELHKKNIVSEHRIDSLESVTALLTKTIQVQSVKIDNYKNKKNESTNVIKRMDHDELYQFFSDFKTSN